MALYRGKKTEDGEKIEEFVGRVISTKERNGYDDSDFLALVETEDGTFEWIEYGTTRFWTYDCYATIDATPEVEARWKAHDKAIREKATAWKREVDAHMPQKGRLAIVTGGRKHKGVIGRIGWIGPGFRRPYGDETYYRDLRKSHGVFSIDLDCRDRFIRVGIDTPDGRVFVSGNQIDVITEPIEDEAGEPVELDV